MTIQSQYKKNTTIKYFDSTKRTQQLNIWLSSEFVENIFAYIVPHCCLDQVLVSWGCQDF